MLAEDSELMKISKDGSKMSVGKIAHAALIDVDKEGAEAAAASTIEIVFLRKISLEHA